MCAHDDHYDTTRRGFIGWVISGLGVIYAAMVGVPVLSTLLGPAFQRRETERWVDFGAIDQLPVGEPRQLTAISQEKDGWYAHQVRRAVWVVSTPANGVVVFYARCTHLGCAYRWDASKRQFACPCHGGTYDISGQVTSGPPPRALDTLASKVEAGKLLVQFV